MSGVDIALLRRAIGATAGRLYRMDPRQLLPLLDEMEAARAVVQAARAQNEQNGYAGRYRTTDAETGLFDALDAYDAAVKP